MRLDNFKGRKKSKISLEYLNIKRVEKKPKKETERAGEK